MKYCRYVDVFQGNDEISLLTPKGIAATWFFIKAQTGNTSPGATLPFGRLSVAPFSGGYPTGYGDRLINCSGKPDRFADGNKLLGFSHLQHSGTGAVGYYYNYAVTTPHYGSAERRTPSDETACPGSYSVRLEDILCELTVSPDFALHRYSFGSDGGRVTVDFANNGLTEDHGRLSCTEGELKLEGDCVTARVVMQGVTLYVSARCYGARVSAEGLKAEFSGFGKTAVVAVNISLKSASVAKDRLPITKPSFDRCRAEASAAWEEMLVRIDVDADEQTKTVFYSNLYHSLVKPCDWGEESLFWSDKSPFFCDFMTLWDMYKTQLPLVFTLCPDVSERIAASLIRTGETLGYIPNSISLSSELRHEDTQARILGSYALMSAYYHGVKLDADRMLSVIEKDIFHPDREDFTLHGRCRSATHTLDMAEGCINAARIARERGKTDLASRLERLGSLWESVFDEDGYITKDSEYYEGSRYNYSFRPCDDMERRIALAGGRERFIEMLDRFFGYGADPVVQPTDPRDGRYIERGMELGRFEGFNNESDMEAPITYALAGRHDRACEVFSAGLEYMFTGGRGGIPGNNDSGALSSLYVWCMLGIFPIAGKDLAVILVPGVRRAEIKLATGNTLLIETVGKGKYAKRIIFNEKILKNGILSVRELMRGGRMTVERSEVV